MDRSGADIVGVQEVRARPEDIPPAARRPSGWHTAFTVAERRGYSGVGLYSKLQPVRVDTSLGVHFLSESSVYRILKAEDLITSPADVVLSAARTFAHPTHRPNELWQTDFTYLQVVGWGWYYLSTVLDDYSRYILAWTLRTSMQAADVTETLDLARARAGVARVRVVHRPRLLSDNGPCYISQELADYLDTHGLTHTRGAPYHPMTQGKIERYHRSMKNVVKLEKYFSPWALQRALARFVEDYNHRRYHESLQNVTPADVYHGRRPAILAGREQIKLRTLQARRRENLRMPHHAAQRRKVSLTTGPQWTGLV